MASTGVEISINDNSSEFKAAMERVTEAALEAIGQKAEGYAKADCPVDTGRLRNSISHSVDTGGKSVYIGTNVEYGIYVEMGTRRMPARPYLKPAAANHGSEYRSIIIKYAQNA